MQSHSAKCAFGAGWKSVRRGRHYHYRFPSLRGPVMTVWFNDSLDRISHQLWRAAAACPASAIRRVITASSVSHLYWTSREEQMTGDWTWTPSETSAPGNSGQMSFRCPKSAWQREYAETLITSRWELLKDEGLPTKAMLLNRPLMHATPYTEHTYAVKVGTGD